MPSHTSIVAREPDSDPIRSLREIFPARFFESAGCDAVFRDASFEHVFGISGLDAMVPVVRPLSASDPLARYLKTFGEACSILIYLCVDQVRLLIHRDGNLEEVEIPQEINDQISAIKEDIHHWAGDLNSDGEHCVDLKSPSPGPHFNVNLLLGNRVDFPNSLQTTPKSVVDRFGGGSFRSHAATQVLATRWDMRPEENGFPANRQFYLLEEGEVIFYSGQGGHANIAEADCRHSQNFTRIFYRTFCGLEIRRLIFILPQKKGRPLATESHRIEITNTGGGIRKIDLVYTGMFGTAAPHALWEDVIYSNVIMQSKILRDDRRNLIAVGSDYYPLEFQKDHRFHCTVAHTPSGPRFPTQFCFDYTGFVGAGTLEKPEFASQLPNRLSRKGPGFFAVGMKIELDGMQTIKIDNFTGLVSSPPDGVVEPEQYRQEITTLLADHLEPDQTERDLDEVSRFSGQYRSCMQIRSDDSDFDTYFNLNLPFQVLYQTYVSRSFGQTQKGYREIGFREIQDLYASIYYFVGMGKHATAKDLIRQWIENVFEFGYANHNFFWQGKEPGKWSDDALWLIPAVYRYICITGDDRILDEEFQMADGEPGKKRRLADTIGAVIDYSAKISIGRHGLPLIDSADWNDCLKIDEDYIDGPAKEKLYQRRPSGRDASESVMNAFLLKHALDLATKLFESRGAVDERNNFAELSKKLQERIQAHAWKEDFFARVLLNRFKKNEYTWIGAAGDGLSADPSIPGVYFLNSFSWSVLSDCATDRQISVMLTAIEKYLKTPHGLKLMTPAALERVAAGTATGHYFPGDRENGAVFKHAAMMAVAALFKVSKQVADSSLARQSAALAYWMIDLALPYKTLKSPYQLGGNPRFCTQYINSDTGENIGPLLSGTSTWLLLSLFSAYGMEFSSHGILLDPILKESQRQLKIRFNSGQAVYDILIEKPAGFYRTADSDYVIESDEERLADNRIPFYRDHKTHTVRIRFV